MTEQNPYAAPASSAAPSPGMLDLSGVERDRMTHRAQEGRVRLFALALAIHGVMRGSLAAMVGLSTLPELSTSPEDAIVLLGTYGFMGGLAALKVAAAYGLHQLKPWGRWVGIVAASMGLLAMPVGTALGVWGLIVLLKPSCERIFRVDYAEVRRRTPHIQWQGKGSAVAAVVVVLASLFLLSLLACAGLVALLA